ncbi:MAG: o-succinylbenzoate synthase [Corynebacterium provencense]|jgi:O-succinylbenzoate synthase|uniref:o-succinylbenzoate synthase n=1 Tax=Corynebacterium provencense TaxID=1737425 RepID=UPI002989B5BE|nr:o-succinylbenzoate synthase [Corynebacterium provencense]
MQLPSLTEITDRAHVVTCPLGVPFRGVTEREMMLVDAPDGWVEWSPFTEYGPEESSLWLRSALLLGWNSPSLPAATAQTVAVNATVPAVDVAADPETVPALLDRYPGCTTVKVKVAQSGQTLADDVARVRAVREARPGIAVRVDANARWSVEEAFDAAVALTDPSRGGGPLDYMEQPCATVEELAELRRRLGSRGMMVRIAADELIRRASDPLAVVQAGACDVAVLKAAPLGGVDHVREIAREVGHYGVAVTVSSALESAVGMYAGLLAAASLPDHTDDEDMQVLPQAAGLATGSLYAVDVCAPRQIIDGHMTVTRVEPEQARLDELGSPATRRDWWFSRLAASYAVLADRWGNRD